MLDFIINSEYGRIIGYYVGFVLLMGFSTILERYYNKKYGSEDK